MQNRRTFLKSGTIGLAATPFLKLPVSHADMPEKITVLFQGDSITDAFRNKGNYYPNDMRGMGNGYVHHIVTHLMGNYPKVDWTCYNRGISGNKVFQLANRWEDDCLQLQPDVLSILIGVNDFWHTLDYNYDGTVKTYEKDFRALLSRTKNQLPNVKLMIAEPFALKGGTAIKEAKWFPKFTAYQSAAKTIAKEFNAVFIPYQKIFDDALADAPVSYWCPDGVHPSLAGAYLMATAWVSTFEEMMK